MATTKRGFTLVGVLAAVIAMIGIFLAGSADAASYGPTTPPPAATTSASNSTTQVTVTWPPTAAQWVAAVDQVISNIEAGHPVTFTITGLAPGVTVTWTFRTTPVVIGTAVANASGVATASVKIPADAAPGQHHVCVEASGVTQCAPVTIAAASSHSGNLAATGVAVIGIGALGLILLVGGGLMLIAGKRRNAAPLHQ